MMCWMIMMILVNFYAISMNWSISQFFSLSPLPFHSPYLSLRCCRTICHLFCNHMKCVSVRFVFSISLLLGMTKQSATNERKMGKMGRGTRRETKYKTKPQLNILKIYSFDCFGLLYPVDSSSILGGILK